MKCKGQTQIELRIELEDLLAAERAVLKDVQRRHFAPEKQILQRHGHRSVNRRLLLNMKVSGLHHLDPVQGKDQLIRIEGRLHRAEQIHEAKHPVILLANDPAILLIIRKVQRTTHIKLNYIHSEIRKKFGLFWAECR